MSDIEALGDEGMSYGVESASLGAQGAFGGALHTRLLIVESSPLTKTGIHSAISGIDASIVSVSSATVALATVNTLDAAEQLTANVALLSGLPTTEEELLVANRMLEVLHPTSVVLPDRLRDLESKERGLSYSELTPPWFFPRDMPPSAFALLVRKAILVSSGVLSRRNAEVAFSSIEGLGYDEIASILNIAPQTVRNVMSGLFRQFDVSNRSEFSSLLTRSGALTSAGVPR